MARHLLYFTAENHYLYSSAGHRLELEAKFSADDSGIATFRAPGRFLICFRFIVC